MRSWSEFNNREKIGIVVIAILLVALPFGYLYRSKAKEVRNINQDLETTVSRIKDNKDVLKKKESLKTEYQSALEELESREQDQPIASDQKSDLIVKLNNLIDEAGLDLITIRLEDGPKSSIGVQQNNSGNQQNNSDYSYQQVPILIEIDGTYSEIVNLVNQIEELKYLIKVNNLNLNTNSQQDLTADSETNIKAQLNLVAFATNDRKGR